MKTPNQPTAAAAAPAPAEAAPVKPAKPDPLAGLPGSYRINATTGLREPADEWTKNFVAKHFGKPATPPAEGQ